MATPKRSQVEIEVQKQVFGQYFDTLVKSIQNSTLRVTNDCLLHKLITPKTQKKILHISDSPGKENTLTKQATELLTAIGNQIEHQKDWNSKFITVLEKHGCSDLIRDFKKSCREARIHKMATECEDHYKMPKPSSNSLTSHGKKRYSLEQASPLSATKLSIQQSTSPTHTKKAKAHMQSRERTIKQHLPQMKIVVQRLIAPIAEKSLAKQIISKEVYKKAVKGKITKEERASFLLHNVCKSVRGDQKKFDDFIEILNSPPSCKDLVRRIREALEESDGLAVAVEEENWSEPVEQVFPLQPPTSSLCHRKQGGSKELNSSSAREQVHFTIGETDTKQASSSDNSKSEILLGSGKSINTKVHRATVHPEREAEYHRKMDKQQDQAQIEDLKRKNELTSLEKQRMSEQILKLKEKVKKKDKEINLLKQEKEDYQLTLDTLKVRYASLEKQLESIPELKKMITHHERKIAKLEKERNDLQEELRRCNEKSLETQETLKETQAALKETQTTLKHNQETLKETQMDLKETRDDLSNVVQLLRQQSQETWSYRTIIAVLSMCLAVIIIVGLSYYMLIAFINVHLYHKYN